MYTQNLVDFVDFVFHSQRRLEILNICVSQSVVDLVDLGVSLIETPKLNMNLRFTETDD